MTTTPEQLQAWREECRKSFVPDSELTHQSELDAYTDGYIRAKQETEQWMLASERLPETPANSTQEFIVACQRKHDGKTYVFAAVYLQELLLQSALPDDDEPEDGKPYTGWYQERNCESGDFDTEWQDIEANGDRITHWMKLPLLPLPQA